MDASTFDRPFGLPVDAEPIVHVLDLPMPPSANKIWRANKAGNGPNRVSRSPAYRAWVKEAGMTLLCTGALRGRKMIRGKFTAIIEIQRQCTALERNAFDLDNRTKVLFDFCQQYRFIENDRDLEEYTVKWTHTNAPRGCRVTLRSCE